MWPLTFSCEFEIINLKKKEIGSKKKCKQNGLVGGMQMFVILIHIIIWICGCEWEKFFFPRIHGILVSQWSLYTSFLILLRIINQSIIYDIENWWEKQKTSRWENQNHQKEKKQHNNIEYWECVFEWIQTKSIDYWLIDWINVNIELKQKKMKRNWKKSINK